MNSSFQHDPSMERLAVIRDTDPAGYSTMGPTAMMSLGFYENAKAAAVAAGIDVTASTA